MYRCSNGQISLSDSKQPAGMKLKESSRWVKKAQTIPWPEIKKRYAVLFANRKGNAAKPLRLALGACIIQAEYGYSDEETALQIQENPYLQYFCGYSGYDDDSDGPPGTGGGSGTMIVDAACAPSSIRYPQDVSLLNEARENAEKLLDALHDPADGRKLRTYRRRARKDYLKYTRCRRHTAKMTQKAIGKQLSYLRRDLEAVDRKLSVGKVLTARQTDLLLPG